VCELVYRPSVREQVPYVEAAGAVAWDGGAASICVNASAQPATLGASFSPGGWRLGYARP
jgi:hypothetical protein